MPTTLYPAPVTSERTGDCSTGFLLEENQVCNECVSLTHTGSEEASWSAAVRMALSGQRRGALGLCSEGRLTEQDNVGGS